MSDEVAVLARQPILDGQQEVVAYELLFRSTSDAESNEPSDKQSDYATASVIVNTIQNFGISEVSGGNPVFINFNESFIQSGLYSVLPKEKVIIDLVGDVFTQESVQLIDQLVDSGFQVSMTLNEINDINNHLLQKMHYVRLDTLQHDFETLHRYIQHLDNYSVARIAHRIETQEIYHQIKQLPIDYFQGYYFVRPDTLQSKKQELSVNQSVLMRLISELQSPDISAIEIAQYIGQDPQLCIQLLKIINSAAYGFTRKISSITEATNMLGSDFIRNWAIMLSMSNIDDKPQELVNVAVIRGKMCEHLAEVLKYEKPNKYFTAGLLSVMDAFVDMPMVQLLKELPLTHELKTALTDYQGKVGKVLKNVLMYEKGEWERLSTKVLKLEHYTKVYLKSVRWMNAINFAKN